LYVSNITTPSSHAHHTQSAGELAEYVTGELNVAVLDATTDRLAWADLVAVPEFQALGKRLGRDMAKARVT
jgi:hypothetical protein